jgi:lactoylglutathione lyase
MRTLASTAALAIASVFTGCASTAPQAAAAHPPAPAGSMELGAFSVSLAVKDLAASRAFYEKLGFVPVGGNPAQNWQILRNGATVIGLFQGMFDENILTFNPGWTQQATPLTAFTDVRELQQRLENAGLVLATKAEPASTGPASLTLVDPDGNRVLIDQHVPEPR